MADASAGLRLGWRIDTLLYQQRMHPDHVDVPWILNGVRSLIDEESSLRPFFSRLLGKQLIVSRNRVRLRGMVGQDQQRTRHLYTRGPIPGPRVLVKTYSDGHIRGERR